MLIQESLSTPRSCENVGPKSAKERPDSEAAKASARTVSLVSPVNASFAATEEFSHRTMANCKQRVVVSLIGELQSKIPCQAHSNGKDHSVLT